ENVDALLAAIEAGKADTTRPTIIGLRTIIGWPSPTKQNTGAIHGSALGGDEIRALKEVLGFDVEQDFEVSDEVFEHVRKVRDRGAAARAEWETSFEAWRTANPEGAALLDRLRAGTLPEGWTDALPQFEAGKAVS